LKPHKKSAAKQNLQPELPLTEAKALNTGPLPPAHTGPLPTKAHVQISPLIFLHYSIFT